MVAYAENVLALDTLRTELRIPTGDTEHDGIIFQHRQAAIDWVEEQTNRSIIDKVFMHQTVYYYEDEPLDLGKLPDLKITDENRVRWWGLHDDFWQPASHENGVGRIYEYAQHRYRVLPLDGKWPIAQNSRLMFVLNTGMDTVPAAFQQAIVLWARALYNGNATLPERATVLRLLEPYMAIG